MDVTTACIAGEEIYRQLDEGRIAGRQMGSRKTPFGHSNELYLVQGEQAAFYLLPRHAAGIAKATGWKINHRANMYALKDLGVRHVLGFAPGGAISHNLTVGDMIVVDDLVDQTYLRAKTFFEDSPLGFLRQFPVFCPDLRRKLLDVLSARRLPVRETGTLAVVEGPRLETPAEVRMLAAVGAEMVSHSVVPEVFLAKELEMCYAAVCYVVNFAETGSRHRPFGTPELFQGLTRRGDNHRLTASVTAMSAIVADVAALASSAQRSCECDKTMSHNKAQYNLPVDWHDWFA